MSVSNMNKLSKSDWDRLAEMEDNDIDLSDIPELEDDFLKKLACFCPLRHLLLNIDADILAWFKAQKDSEKRINIALRIYAEAHQRAV
ncbi:MAG: hypothetical protein R2865_01615 [Deinococcales bacterium]